MRPTLVLALLALALAPALALPSGMDAHVGLSRGAQPTLDDPAGILRVVDATPGEAYVFAVNATEAYSTIEIEAHGAVDVERPRQLVPHLRLDPREPSCRAAPGACDYTIFEPFPNERVWEVDSPARVFFVNGTKDDFVLRLGIPGPVNATLTLVRDAKAPGYAVKPPTNVTSRSFFQETTTDELAIADLQVRKVGAAAWIPSPTPVYHVLQRFPIQGLDANATYEARIVFTDWAGNSVTTDVYTVRTAPEPAHPLPSVTILSPAENATLPPGAEVTLRALVESPESPVPREGVRVFFDKQEVTERAAYSGGEVAFLAGALDAGRHSASVEVQNEAGGRAVARWTFEVESPARAPVPWGAALVAAFVAAAAMRRR